MSTLPISSHKINTQSRTARNIKTDNQTSKTKKLLTVMRLQFVLFVTVLLGVVAAAPPTTPLKSRAPLGCPPLVCPDVLPPCSGGLKPCGCCGKEALRLSLLSLNLCPLNSSINLPCQCIIPSVNLTVSSCYGIQTNIL